ncbi:class I SAM-dependent methyltransferase [Aquimarina sp. ERC-38]|uniref:class I SAM-dependent methyltransferase n=1 Tax=Aquimarina sp. ERC-38 TaxID=2949996 RepID=UPI00224696C5|nr:class I SAM-dependent methyltransferase [Aquimarina sp. ERC-38]UZO80466.1 class I SAM-dependent methyltransferase [Aquimarina sp. ERC-38]
MSAQQEKERYLLHNNNPKDSGYRKFLQPIVDHVTTHYMATANGLDFGSGPIPAMEILLREKKYKITSYDPYFTATSLSQTTTYDFIIVCEVMEHFKNPAKEFSLLYSLLQTGGELICKTSLFNINTDFKNWWYKNDPTHVFFYTETTLQVILNQYKFKKLKIMKDYFILQK